MRFLLDTHVLLWWLQGARLADEAAEQIADASNEVIVSAATVPSMGPGMLMSINTRSGVVASAWRMASSALWATAGTR